MTIEELKYLKESENKVEFKEAKGGYYSYNGGNKPNQQERKKCILGYVVAIANEGGGYLVFGMTDKHPHSVCGTNQNNGSIGVLEQDIYRDLKVRVGIEELFDEAGRRVLVIKIPSRPIGKVLTFDDIALMRVGEELVRMSDDKYRLIINEQEPDFSNTICEKLTFEDLDSNAIDKMKSLYAQKQDNPQFLTLSSEQVLSDLNLLTDGKLKFASLILVGSENAICKYLPQAEVRLEYRNNADQISFDSRFISHKPYFLMIDELWNQVDLRNGKVPIQEGNYIFDIPFFNQEVIREALNNAIAHRDYRLSSEIVVKQSTQELRVTSPGGFPLGVTIENLIKVPSTPRNRLLAEILEKTGAVERAGQGVDKMFFNSLAEAKQVPDYSCSDNFQVEVKLSAVVKDKAFAIFIKDFQMSQDENKLSLSEIITLEKIRNGIDKSQLSIEDIQSLTHKQLIEKTGKTRNLTFRLNKTYYTYINKEGSYSNETPLDPTHIELLIIKHLTAFNTAKMKDFSDLFTGLLTREQVKKSIYKFVKSGLLETEGKGYSVKYKLGSKFKEDIDLLGRAIKVGLDELKRRGEIL